MVLTSEKQGVARRPPRLLVKAATAFALLGYRASGGRIGGRFGRASVLLLTTTGRKTGKRRTNPLAYFEDGDALVLIASYGGADVHPAWYLNLAVTPDVEVRLRGGKPQRMRARTAAGEERERLWARVVEMWAGYTRYQKKTSREFPLVILEAPSEVGASELHLESLT